MIKKAVSYVLVPKKLVYAVAGLAAAGILVWVLNPQKTPVDVQSLSRGDLQIFVTEEGVTNFKTKHVLSAPADGITPTVNWKPGDSVAKGQVLLTFFWNINFDIKSPVAGYILNVFEKDRRSVPRGTPLIEVGDPSDLEVITKILSEDVVSVRVGQKAEIKNWGGSEVLEAEVVKIEPTAREEISALGVKEQRVRVFLKITSPRELWKTLGDAFRVDVAIITQEKANVLRLPVGALFLKDQKPTVFQFVEGRVRVVPIEIGDRNSEVVEVHSGLSEGDVVVMYPDSKLKDGDRVYRR